MIFLSRYQCQKYIISFNIYNHNLKYNLLVANPKEIKLITIIKKIKFSYQQKEDETCAHKKKSKKPQVERLKV